MINIGRITLIICIIIAITSCQKSTSPRALYWSGAMMLRSDVADSLWELSLGYYVEISDTSETIMMRKMYSENEEYFRIIMPDSVKNRILDLALRNSFSNKKNRLYISSNDRTIATYSDECIYNMRIIQDTIDRTIAFKRDHIHEALRQLTYMLEDIVTYPEIKDTIKFELNIYRDKALQTILQVDTTFSILPFPRAFFNWKDEISQ